MRKILIILLSGFLVNTSYAQLTGKNGEEILPKQGNFGITADLTPLVRPLFNLSINESQHSVALFNNGKTLGAKYFLKDDLALRAKFRFNRVSTKVKALVTDDLAEVSAIDPPELDEFATLKEFNSTIILGVEKRRGDGRLQGVFGGETGVLFGNGLSVEYTYANEVTADNVAPLTTDFSNETTILNSTATGRIVSQNFGYNFSYILRGFVGMEYYFLPKMSLGLEFAWGMDLSSQKDGIYSEEFWDTTKSSVVVEENITRGKTSVGFDNYEAMLNFNFYF